MLRIALVAGLSLVVLAAPAAAQNLSANRGFVLGAHLIGAGLDPEDGSGDSGGGLGIMAGWGFGDHLQLQLDGAALRMNPEDEAEDYTLGHGDLALRYAFLTPSHRWRPFVEGGASWFSVEWQNISFGEAGEVDLKISGPGIMVGGGVDLFVSPAVALEAGLRWAAGAFDEVEINNVTVKLEGTDRYDVRTSRLQFGAKYYFSGR